MHAILAFVLLAGAPAPQTVTLSLEEFEALRKLRERPSVTVVDQLRVVGSFAGHDLAVELSGRTAGTQPAVPVLDGGVRPYACQGDALLFRDDGGRIALTPLAGRFAVRCRLGIDGSDRLEAVALPAVLEVTASVSDGELVAEPHAEGGRQFSVVRKIAGDGGSALPPSVVGQYRVTLLPDETRFLYRLAIRNPGRGHRKFELALREAEHVESVNAPIAWDAEGTRYRLDLPPGETTVELIGRLTGTSFVPPVPASIQYLLVESHPLIRPELRTEAKRVGVGEVGIAPQYRGAQAFLLDGGGEVAWTTTRLEALKTAGFAVRELSQIFFLGADGAVRGETTLDVDNQGAPSLSLPLGGDPTFASVQGEPMFLTRDASGSLFIPLAQGPQRVLTQDVRRFSTHLGIGVARLELPRPGTIASRARVELRYPDEWIPVFESLPPRSRVHLLDESDLGALAVLLGLVLWVLALGGVARRTRWVLGGSTVLLAALAASARAPLTALAAAPLVMLAAALTWRNLAGWRRALALAGEALCLLIAIAVMGGVVFAPAARAPSYRYASYDQESEQMLGSLNSNVMAGKEKQRLPAAAAPAAPQDTAARAQTANALAYEGVPAKIDLPSGAGRSHFSREMVASQAGMRVTVVAIASRAVAALRWLAAALLLLLGFLHRTELTAGARKFAERVRGRLADEGGGATTPG
jgi:hypothetical protein